MAVCAEWLPACWWWEKLFADDGDDSLPVWLAGVVAFYFAFLALGGGVLASADGAAAVGFAVGRAHV